MSRANQTKSSEKTIGYYKVALWATLATVVWIVLEMWIYTYWTTDGFWKNLVVVFLNTLISASALVATWEFFAKKAFATEIFGIAKISANLKEVGIEHVYMDFQEIDWKPLFDNSTTCTIAVTHATTWREHNRTTLQDYCEAKKTLNVYLPDCEDVVLMARLANRFNMPAEKMQGKIQESKLAYETLGAQVFCYGEEYYASYYLFDNVGIMALFNHSKEKATVPAFITNRQGLMYGYIKSELECIASNISERSIHEEK